MNYELWPGDSIDIPAGMSMVTVMNGSPQQGAFEITIEGNTKRYELFTGTMQSIELAEKKGARINNVGGERLKITSTP